MEMFQCPLCKAVIENCSASLSHECHVVSTLTNDGDEVALERYRLNQIERERDKNERAGFASQMHANYLCYLTKLVVPYEGRHVDGFCSISEPLMSL